MKAEARPQDNGQLTTGPASAQWSVVSGLELPELHSTEEATRFGQSITRDRFIYLCGARAAMRQVFDELRVCYGKSAANMQLRADLACRMQLIREALDEAPPAVRASIVGLGLEGTRQDLPDSHETENPENPVNPVDFSAEQSGRPVFMRV